MPLFAHLSPESLRLLVERLVQRHCAPGEMVFSEGQACEGLYLVEAGLVKLYKVSKDGREQVVATHGPGQTLSELPMIDGERYPFSAVALVTSVLFFISTENLQILCHNEPGCTGQVLRIVAARLRTALGMIEELSFATVRARLAAYLLRTAGAKSLQNGYVVQLPANHEIAAHIGTVRELVSRHLARLQLKGIVRITGRTMQVLDVNALAKEAGVVSGRARRDRSSRSALLVSAQRNTYEHRAGDQGCSHECAVLARRNAATSVPHLSAHARRNTGIAKQIRGID
ncbi:MAG TPA: Crp/Fnr family transcriptional regulator [Terriglobales bacterium]|nr:Crp/Fnr family transcriptional regulator [Terriglobales bacterium]